MSGVGMQWQLVDFAELQRRVDAISDMDTRHLMDSIGAEVTTQTQRRISDEKTSPDGVAWPKWSDAYAKTREGGQSLLLNEGDLVRSITHVVELGGREVDVGSNLVYAKIQNFGGAKVGKPNLPAREWLGLSNENKRDVQMVSSDFLDHHLSVTFQ
jgi:phage virion morphogenesis protein